MFYKLGLEYEEMSLILNYNYEYILLYLSKLLSFVIISNSVCQMAPLKKNNRENNKNIWQPTLDINSRHSVVAVAQT